MSPELRRFVRRVAWIYAIVLSAICLILSAGHAKGAEPALTPTTIADRSEAWIASQLHAPIPHRPIVRGEPAQMDLCRGGRPCIGVAWTDRIDLSAGAWLNLAQLGVMPHGSLADPNADGFVLPHEQLHTSRDERRIDEGVVDAVALDLTPAWARQVLGLRASWQPTPRYPREVARVRAASAKATGGSWRTRDARGWRRWLWAQTSDVRVAAIAEALA